MRISTHAPLAGRDPAPSRQSGWIAYFNPRAPCGARLEDITLTIPPYTFQPTRPLRGATYFCVCMFLPITFQPTRPLRGATRKVRKSSRDRIFQPTRPLRGATRSDRQTTRRCADFNPRAPCGARPMVGQLSMIVLKFQPTRPLRGATVAVAAGVVPPVFQPTRPLRGATGRIAWIHQPVRISTHAPLAGRDSTTSTCSGSMSFQPTRPLRGATARRPPPAPDQCHFNPRAPCGARQQKCTNHYAHFCDNRQISDAFAQNAACQGILLLFDAGKSCGFWVRTAQVISAHLCFAL